MGLIDEGSDVNTVKEAALLGHARGSSPRRVPRDNATGRALPITPEEQAQKARAIAAFVERMMSMPDEDPPGAWEEAMRDLDAHRPHRKLFEGLFDHGAVDPAGQRAARHDSPRSQQAACRTMSLRRRNR